MRYTNPHNAATQGAEQKGMDSYYKQNIVHKVVTKRNTEQILIETRIGQNSTTQIFTIPFTENRA